VSGLDFIPLGVGDAFSRLYYSSCLALQAEGSWLLVDCPHPIRKMMHEAGTAAGVRLDIERFETVVLTHLHADHVSGLEGYAYFSYFHLGRRASVHAHPRVLEHLWPGHLVAGMGGLMDTATAVPAAGAATPGAASGTGPGGGGQAAPRARRFEDYFAPGLLDLAGPTAIGPFSIECRLTTHHIPTTALRIRAGDRALAYSADTAYDPALVAWLAEADLVLHETGRGVHTPHEQLAELPADLRRRMRLIHYPDDLTAELAGRTTAIERLQQGRRYQV
jgi:ribonuclease BN (tRNA processing enzyme)